MSEQMGYGGLIAVVIAMVTALSSVFTSVGGFVRSTLYGNC